MPVKPINTLSSEDAIRVYAWARYVHWADVECRQYDAHEPAPDEPTLGLRTVLMIQFYAALWVAIEGWRSCSLSDDVIDELLTDPAFQRNVDLLRRFRNGVYHYQPVNINERLLDFLREGEVAVAWAFLVHDEFKRVVWEVAHPGRGSQALQKEFADAVLGIVGWLPSDVPEAAPQKANERHREVLELIEGHGTRSTPEARELLDAFNRARVAAHDASAGWKQEKRAMIDVLKRCHQASPNRAT